MFLMYGGRSKVISNPHLYNKIMKSTAKSIASLLMMVLTCPVYLLCRLEALLVGERKAFGMVSQWVSLAPGLTGEWFRRGYLQWAIGLNLKDCCISFGCTFSDHRVKIGDGVYLGTRCDIGYADIGANCVIGSGVHILSGLRQHGFEDLDAPIKDQPGEYSMVTIGEDTWIGNGAIIAADVGKRCVIGVGSVVVKPIPDFAIAVGNPARVIRHRQR